MTTASTSPLWVEQDLADVSWWAGNDRPYWLYRLIVWSNLLIRASSLQAKPMYKS